MLKLDVDCEKLARNLHRDRQSLPGPFTAFLHKALRKVAAHYGLAVEAGPDAGAVSLCRTGATRIPATRLQDLPGPRPSSDEEGPHAGLGLAAAGPADAGAPRVVGVMRRSPSASGASDARAPAAPVGMSVEEREAAYERARERILGAATADAPAPDDGNTQQAAPAPQREAAAQQAAETAAAERDAAADARRAAPAASGAPPQGGSSAQRRAVMRDREKDLADPDFARRAPPQHYGGGPMGGPMGPGAYGFGQAPYGEAPYGYAQQQGGDYPPLGAAGGGTGRGGWSGGGGGGYGGGGGGGGGGYWPPLGGGGAAQGPYAAYAGAGRGQGAPVYGAYQGRGGGQQGQDRGGW